MYYYQFSTVCWVSLLKILFFTYMDRNLKMCFLKQTVYLHTYIILFNILFVKLRTPYSSNQTCREFWHGVYGSFCACYFGQLNIMYNCLIFYQFLIGHKNDINTMPYLTHLSLAIFQFCENTPPAPSPMAPSQKIGPHPQTSPPPFNLDVIIPFYYYSM